ncbi:MAG: type III-A CRISPR-associated RAMP protein Csm3, partial [candidate division KSB1 bacterium]|nr:type III-A CRISPR-associated RAMP protein Csm3 [candidate division KSB1 bacterium]
PARLLVRDVSLAQNHEATERLRHAKTDLPFTEVKWEAAIDRITSAAVPRQNERVPAGAVFAPFELVYSLYDLDGAGCQGDIDRLPYVLKAMELLEDDYLGGHGSRGAGKLAFTGVTVLFKSHAYYEGHASIVTLDEQKNLRQLKPPDYGNQISDLIQ